MSPGGTYPMEEMTASSQNRSPQQIDPSIADRWLLRVRGPVEVEIVDEKGGRIGRFLPREGESEGERRFPWPREREGEGSLYQSRPNLFEITIPGATFNPGRDFVSAFLSQPGIYTCTFIGQAPAAVDIYLTSFS